jgi:hypothetical protein
MSTLRVSSEVRTVELVGVLYLVVERECDFLHQLFASSFLYRL